MDYALGNNISVSQKITGLLERKPVILQLLRFGCIGVLNFTIHAIVVNMVSKHLGIDSGTRLGVVNITGFVVAVIQSYVWNKYWTFGNDSYPNNVLRNFFRLVAVGSVGVLGFVLVLIAAKIGAPAFFFLGILLVYLLSEIVLWMSFGLKKSENQVKLVFVKFLIVSVIGLAINSLIVSLASTYLNNQQIGIYLNRDLIKNLSLVLANVVSLIWNFIGYKLLVFKK